MAATKALGFVLPTGLFIQPSLNRRGGVRVSVFQCSVSSLTSTGTDFPISLFALFDLFPELWIEIGLLEKPWSSYNARLVLEDGSMWSAKSFGASGTRVAELVFNTSLTGYQEILTDPSYAGQFVLMTNPQIGNTGVNPDDEESRQCFLVIRSLSISTSNWRCTKTLGDYLAERNIMGIYDLDTRVIAYDFGIKQNILRRLASYGCEITVVPSTWPAAEALKMNPDGILFSNGPGDPSAVPYAVETVKELLGKVPVYGICMGHQLLGQALGGKTYKMKFGHHGGNHPVCNNRTGHVEISAQNHNYAVDPASLPSGVEVTHVNLNDGSCAGLSFPAMNVMSLQYHPEASPGPHDSDNGITLFFSLLSGNYQNAKAMH
ncbi:hypothetical protein ARALYDRAFT_920999 [Arabidopsis lyrata subsp. lyrata]|uniref:carbamoyl-phosphate synthase (glutamine-hydrolyzing) n=1 Tax=Arabidopsis lyrata subsp. lyrata TaxID=81972 RepID=D7MY65_ARALL|nr:hypothetical protein ARALYDRAFT_920999 [Arabidopsis lyrata subsp. lyrata]